MLNDNSPLINQNLLMVSIKSIFKVKNIVDSEICVSVDDGEKVYNEINKVLKKRNAYVIEQINKGNLDYHKHKLLDIDIDFTDVTVLTAAFLNAAIGELYSLPLRKFTSRHIQYIGLSEEDKSFVERVSANAIQYHDNPERWIAAVDKVMEDLDLD